MNNDKFVIVNHLSQSAKYLTPLVFNKEALQILLKFGLFNVYLDDYGHTRKYKNCLFFLFGGTKMENFDKFEDKITSFSSFYDYYDVVPQGYPKDLPTPEYRMYVFKLQPGYYADLFSFKHGRFDELSEEFYRAGGYLSTISNIHIDLSKEIYRFEKTLVKEKEAL